MRVARFAVVLSPFPRPLARTHRRAAFRKRAVPARPLAISPAPVPRRKHLTAGIPLHSAMLLNAPQGLLRRVLRPRRQRSPLGARRSPPRLDPDPSRSSGLPWPPQQLLRRPRPDSPNSLRRLPCRRLSHLPPLRLRLRPLRHSSQAQVGRRLRPGLRGRLHLPPRLPPATVAPDVRSIRSCRKTPTSVPRDSRALSCPT